MVLKWKQQARPHALLGQSTVRIEVPVLVRNVLSCGQMLVVNCWLLMGVFLLGKLRIRTSTGLL